MGSARRHKPRLTADNLKPGRRAGCKLFGSRWAFHTHGATDEHGYEAVEGKVHLHDLHATMLHLLGLDHERLTYRHGGREYRLTDVHGSVVRGVLAS